MMSHFYKCELALIILANGPVFQVMDAKTHFKVANTTNMVKPAFTVTGLMPGTGYVVSITSGNSKGRSQPVRLHAFTTKLPDQLAESGTVQSVFIQSPCIVGPRFLVSLEF